MKHNKLDSMTRMSLRTLAVPLLMLCAAPALAQDVWHVSPAGGGDGSSWDSPVTLHQALGSAKAGDEVWVQGFEVIDGTDKLYTLERRDDSFTVPSGVKVYGGFKGDETGIDERETLGKLSEMRYRSVLSGDVAGNDALHDTYLIFPDNQLRDDNAKHVVILDLAPTKTSGNNNTLPTVLDGLSIAEGHASGDAQTADGRGGGVLVTGDNADGGAFMITNCFFVNNYARRGGAVAVDATVDMRPTESVISYCTIFNNAAGERSSANNSGGGLWLEGDCTVANCEVFNNENGGIAIAEGASVVNSTVARNTGSGIERIGDGEAFVRNTVIWGNSYLYSTLSPTFYNSSYHEVELTDGATVDANGNRYVSDRNRGNDVAVPMFESPSTRTSYDREFDWPTMSYPLWSWDIQEGSAFIDGGRDDFYNDIYGTVDMAGDARLSGTIDIGAYEHQTVSASRIRYVKPDGSDMADGMSWATAYHSVQHAIDDLAARPGVRGEVWVAAGTYYPTAYLEGNPTYPASFRIVDGISVYGGFAGDETSKDQRERVEGGLPWQFANKTELCGATYDGNFTSDKWNATDQKWSVNSASTHVVWFAPLLGEGSDGFSQVTVLDGVTIKGGQATTSQASYYYGDRGAGVYMGRNAYLTNSVVTENVAASNGGAVYLDGGRVMSSLISNNSAEAQGGGIYVDNAGIVMRSMIANNSAYQGGGVYLASNSEWSDELRHPEYLILTTCVVSNNTSTANGAVYCDNGGVILQSTITNNDTPRATDLTDENASQTGGLYIDTYALVINSVLWNNQIKGATINTYVKNSAAGNVRFMNVAVSSMNSVVWNNVLTEGMLPLADTNITTEGQVSPDFALSGLMASDGDISDRVGVQPEWAGGIDYYWQPVSGSNLRAEGVVAGTFPEEVLLEPEQDMSGKLFAQKPSIGAWEIDQTDLTPEVDGNVLRLYVDIECTDPDHNGSSWATAYRSLNEAVSYFASLPAGEVADKQLEIYVKEGNLFPIYAFGNLDPKTAHLAIKRTNSNLPLRIVGGWDGTDGGTQDPLTNRTTLNGNLDGLRLEEGLYHVIMVEPGANVVLDGFHVVGGYAAGTATITSGAGMMIYDGATVEVRNCIFENNTATDCAAIDGRQQGVSLSLINTVIANNTNTNAASPVVASGNLTLNHVTVANNQGAAPSATYTNSFAVGNTLGDTLTGIASTGETGAANFRNPANRQGATLGFDTYYGGYSDYTPLTSAQAVATAIINRGTVTAGLDNDIAMHGRDLGGVPDIGAYEAALPESGRVYYVRKPDDGGNDSHSGLSWDEAFATIRKAVDAASRTEVIDGEKAQVWVAAGNYAQDPINGSDNCFEIVEAVNVYGAFPRTGNPSMDERRPFISDEVWFDNEGGSVTAAGYETILRPATANNDVRRVLGQADMFNPFSTSTELYYFYVGGGQGNYDIHGDEVVGELNMPAGNYVYATAGSTYYEEYNWMGQGQNAKELVYVGSSYGEYRVTRDWLGRTTWESQSGGGYSEFKEAGYYLCSDDVATHYSDGQYMYCKDTSGATPVEGGDYVLKESEFTYPTTWDGFTIRDGYLNSARLRFLDNNIDSSDRSGGKRNGGAGAAIFTNVTLANSVVFGNQNVHGHSGQYVETRGGGVYCDEGTLVNCYVLNNTLGDSNDETGYGAGVYMFNATAYNCVIAGNTGNAQNSDGAGVLVDNNNIFFNNTIVGNHSNGGTRGAGGVCIWQDRGASSSLVMYNCVVLSNSMQTIGTNVGDENVAAQNGEIICYNSIVGKLPSGGAYGNAGKRVRFVNCQIGTTSIFEGYGVGNYRLAGNGDGSIAINRGENEPVIGGETYFLMDYTDMDFTARIKDCTIDAGAYEFEQTTATPDANGIYYVTQNGAGTASGESPTEAACASKLQIVLNAAGERVRAGRTATVRLGVPEKTGFTFTANTLSNANDPQSYTFVVPYGVQLEGGWNEDFNTRNPYNYPTSLSPVATVGGVTVNGYHAVVFGERTGGQQGLVTVIDGLFLEDGQAVSASGSGSPNAKGGGAVVPSWGHVRNCVVRGNAATRGGGLYVEPGGMVSGTLVYDNTAEDGAGIYAARTGSDGGEVGAANRAHLMSLTVTDNEATAAGGGICLEDGAAMTVNSIVWGNDAPSDKNVSGALYALYEDDLLSAVATDISAFYPFNNCFVETYEMPGNFANTSLESGEAAEEKYFVGVGLDRSLKEYSPMVKHGSAIALQTYLQENNGVAETDIQGLERIQDGMEKVDAGAFAFDGGAAALPRNINEVVTRLFVSQTENVKLREGEDEALYRGKSFLTSFTWLDDALLYVQTMRETFQGQTNDEGQTIDEIEFEILVASGTYKPHYRRADAVAATTADQRQNSFVVPHGVKIYGGFSGTESLSSEGIEYIPATAPYNNIYTDGGATPIKDLADGRDMDDLNANGVIEAWEMANQTILSGEVNTSSLVGNVYHVVFSDKGDAGTVNPVVLDGLTVNYGETASDISGVLDNNERGRGAGVYSSGVDYIIKGCRLLNCKAVRGGALFARDADVMFISSLVAGNGTVDNANAGELDTRGGAVYVAGVNAPASVRAVNTVFANNETTDQGAAIATSDDLGDTYPVVVDVMNSMFVRNKAMSFSAVYANQDNCRIANSVIWGNETPSDLDFNDRITVTHTASDHGVTAGDGNGNIVLGTTNLAIDGPRFKNPSTVAGVAGNTSAALWNPAAISVLTDVGDGELAYDIDDMTQATGAYKDWMAANASDYEPYYMSGDYKRYAGPAPAKGKTGQPKVIDLGAYEYQYESKFSNMDYVYVDVQEHGDGSGDSWENATSNFRGALTALANPDGNDNKRGEKVVYVRGGDYFVPQLNVDGVVYDIRMSGSDNTYVSSLTVDGSYDETGNHDFSQPTRIVPSSGAEAETNTMMSVNVNGKEVNLVGLSFEDGRQHGLYANNSMAGGNLTLRNVAFRGNATGASVHSGEGTSNLFVNALFADGGTGLDVAEAPQTTVVNATFANNRTAISGTADVVNSMAWRSGDGLETDADRHNHDFGTVDNTDLNNGPNFVSPETGDYNIRPSITVLEAGSSDLYQEKSGVAAADDQDLDGADRVTGAEIDLGAYEYDAELRQVIYVRTGVAGGDNSGSDWNNPIDDLQDAVDLASVYHNKNTDSEGYVFVHNDVTVPGEVRVSMPGVRVYGGMATVSTAGTPDEVLGRRGCFLAEANRSTLDGGLMLGAGSLVDGFSVDGNVSVSDEAMLSTSVIEPTGVVTLDEGTLYNSFVGGTVSGVGEAVNVTAANALSDGLTKKNVYDNAVQNGYVNEDVWSYQLKEDNALIDGGDTQDISAYIARAGHSKDLSGTSRVRNAVDGGCFETWFVNAPTTVAADDCPTGSHVVYVTPGQELSLDKGLTSDTAPFEAGFLLLQHGAGLFANGNWVSLDNFAIERTIDEDGDLWDLAYAPYDVTRTTVDGADYAGSGAVSVMTYDGARRASYGYRFSATDGAWVGTEPAGHTGLLLESADGASHTVRLYGESYEESPETEAVVSLKKYNYSDPWASPEDGESDRFTHTENMSWNLFGSPYLSGMNYGDMEYGRVIYKKNGNAFAAVNTMDKQSSQGSIGAGAAVFTQTATLADEERVRIAHRSEELQGPGTRSGNLAIALADGEAEHADEFVLTAVPTDEALSDFDMAGDGVKMMSVDTTASQIYITRGSSRYSLLSAVDVEGTVGVGLHLDAAGSYEIGIPEDCPAYDYETVVLTDNATGRVVDLLDAPYAFNVGDGGEIQGRFTIQFNRSMADDAAGITVYSDSNGDIIVDGLTVGMRIRLYDASGRMTANRVAASTTETFTGCERGVCLVQVIDGDSEPQVFKAMVGR